jgi:pyruvate/2-oxoacid:ferredoxin oxidoreductase alpha subunit
MALISHIVAHRSRTPVIHTFDGDLVARASAVVDRLEFDNAFLEQACNATHNTGGVPEAFTAVFDELASVLGKR